MPLIDWQGSNAKLNNGLVVTLIAWTGISSGTAAAPPAGGPPDEDGWVLTHRHDHEPIERWEPLLPSVVSFLAQKAATGTEASGGAVTELSDPMLRLRCVLGANGADPERLRARVGASGTYGTTCYAGVQYSIDDGVTWKWLDGTDGADTAGEPKADISLSDLDVSAWVDVTGEAKADALLRPVLANDGSDANGTLSRVYLELSKGATN